MLDLSKNIISRIFRIVLCKPLITLTIVLGLLFFSSICYLLPHSHCYYWGDLNYAGAQARNRDEWRIGQARTYFYLKKEKFNSNNEYEYPSKDYPPPLAKAPSLHVVIRAIDRNTGRIDAYQPNYLTQTLFRLLKGLDDDQQTYGSRWSSINISICNVDNQGTFGKLFSEAIFLSEWIQIYSTKNKSLRKLFGNPNCGNTPELRFCLDVAIRNSNADFILLMEDDVLVKEDTWDTLWNIVNNNLKVKQWKKTGFIQLRQPLNIFYDSDRSHFKYYGFLLLLSSILTLFLLFVHSKCHNRNNSLFVLTNRSNSIILCLFLFIWINMLNIGELHWIEFYCKLFGYYLSESDRPDVSTVIMPNITAKHMLQHISQYSCKFIDGATALDQYVSDNELRVLTVYPNLFSHIGLYSHIDKTTINPFFLEE